MVSIRRAAPYGAPPPRATSSVQTVIFAWSVGLETTINADARPRRTDVNALSKLRVTPAQKRSRNPSFYGAQAFGMTDNHLTEIEMEQDNKQTRVRAYELWEEEGRPEGRHNEHWSQAEKQTAAGNASAEDAVEHALGPSHGNEDFGGHDAEAEGSAQSGVGVDLGDADLPVQAPTDVPEEGEKPIRRES